VYVNLEYIYGATRIATLKDQGEELASSQFGGVLFTRSDSTDIRSLYDVRGKTLAGVDRTSFGGWLILWRLLQQSGINPYNDLAAVRFLGSHRKVVVDVLN
jgi:ABC-type phosphate/phosphonate transport system substrate-binding protein